MPEPEQMSADFANQLFFNLSRMIFCQEMYKKYGSGKKWVQIEQEIDCFRIKDIV